MHVIWQYGKRGESNQTVLTIGRTQIENNYRVRVISNSSDGNGQQLSGEFTNSQTNSGKLIVNNLEIRKLQLSDSGWYECQLPTKPTQKNYIYLEVLSFPRIESTKKYFRSGDQVELICEVKNSHTRHELQWFFNDEKINSHIDKNRPSQYEETKSRHHFQAKDLGSRARNTSVKRHKRKNGSAHRRNSILKRNLNSFTIINDNSTSTNKTISKLRIDNLEEFHKGVYKCRYEKAEAKFSLDFKSNSHTSNIQKTSFYYLNL
jgi:hypothetical protein